MIENFKIDSNEIDKINFINKEDKNFRIENLNAFNSTGFPSKKEEDWKFSDTRAIFSKNFGKLSLDNSNSKDEFFEKNKMYCSVSGSLVRPGSQPEFVSVRGHDEELICGSLYRCCWPCSCDVMKYVQVQALEKTFGDKTELINVLTIKNPCEKPDFPEEVDRESICVGTSLNKKRVTEINGRLVVGVLFESKICSPKDIEKINREVITGSYCPLRNNTPLKEVRGGMGDIFIKMAN